MLGGHIGGSRAVGAGCLPEVLLMLKEDGVAAASRPPAASRWRNLRSMSNSRRRTKSLRWRRSIISLSISRL
jgi:hypothetical protein